MNSPPDADTIEADLVVVGAGGAGMAAALEAAMHGLRVVLLEKAPKVGGTTALSVGSIMAAGGTSQRRAGIVDTPAAHARDLDDIRRAMGAEDDPELRRLLTENVADTIEFLRAAGLNFLGPLPQPPHQAPRLHQVMPTSRAYAFQLERQCRRHGVDIRLNAPMESLLLDGKRVVGALARIDGRERRLRSRAGVILASGDIGANNAMMYEFMKNWADGIEVYNPLNTGDGHEAARAIGARIVPRKDLPAETAAHVRFVRPPASFLHRIPPYPFLTRAMVLAMRVLPAAAIRPLMMRFLTTILGPDRGVFEAGAILVNASGERFADECREPNLHIPKQPGGVAHIVFDERFARKFSRWPHFISTAPGVAFAFVDDYRKARPDLFTTAATLDELARRRGFPPRNLAEAVAAVNRERTDERRLDQPPFHAIGPVKTWVMVAPVGLAVNSRLEVLNQANEVIPGLYAAGNAGQAGFTVTGHGHGLGWAFTTGRLAARSAWQALGR